MSMILMHRLSFVFTAAAVLFSLTVVEAMNKKSAAYPSSRKEKVVDKIHGVEIPDPYRWLEAADSKEVQAWGEKQNQYTRSILDKLPGRKPIRARLSQLMDIGSLGTPWPV